MSGYAKIFEAILESTVWGLSKEARILWITILVKKDRRQVVRASVPGLAHAARLSVDETRAALAELEAPDPDSQSQDQEGRRIVRLPDGGWFVVNGAKYRDMLSLDDRREYQRVKQAEYRAAKKAAAAGGGASAEPFAEPAAPVVIEPPANTDTPAEKQMKRPEYRGEPRQAVPIPLTSILNAVQPVAPAGNGEQVTSPVSPASPIPAPAVVPGRVVAGRPIAGRVVKKEGV